MVEPADLPRMPALYAGPNEFTYAKIPDPLPPWCVIWWLEIASQP